MLGLFTNQTHFVLHTVLDSNLSSVSRSEGEKHPIKKGGNA